METCPLDSSHRVNLHDVLPHINQCKKDHPGVFKVTCSCSSVVELANYYTHVMVCSDRIKIRKEAEAQKKKTDDSKSNKNKKSSKKAKSKSEDDFFYPSVSLDVKPKNQSKKEASNKSNSKKNAKKTPQSEKSKKNVKSTVSSSECWYQDGDLPPPEEVSKKEKKVKMVISEDPFSAFLPNYMKTPKETKAVTSSYDADTPSKTPGDIKVETAVKLEKSADAFSDLHSETLNLEGTHERMYAPVPGELGNCIKRGDLSEEMEATHVDGSKMFRVDNDPGWELNQSVDDGESVANGEIVILKTELDGSVEKDALGKSTTTVEEMQIEVANSYSDTKTATDDLGTSFDQPRRNPDNLVTSKSVFPASEQEISSNVFKTISYYENYCTDVKDIAPPIDHWNTPQETKEICDSEHNPPDNCEMANNSKKNLRTSSDEMDLKTVSPKVDYNEFKELNAFDAKSVLSKVRAKNYAAEIIEKSLTILEGLGNYETPTQHIGTLNLNVVTKPQDIVTKPLDIATKLQDIVTKPMNIATKPLDIATKLQDIVTKHMNIATKPLDISTKPQDIATKPLDISIKPLDIATKPQDIATKPQDIATKPQDIATKPQDIATKPQDIATKPQDIATKPQDIATKPQDIATKPQDIANKPQDIATKPQDIATKPQDIVTKQQDIATKQQDIATKQQDIATKQQDIATKPQVIATKPQDLATKPQDIATKPQNVVTQSQPLNLGTKSQFVEPLKVNIDPKSIDLTTKKDDITNVNLNLSTKPPNFGFQLPVAGSHIPATSFQLPPVGSQHFPDVGSQQLPDVGSQQLPAVGSQKFPAVGSQLLPAVGSQLLPAVGSQLLPAVGSQQLPAVGSQLTKNRRTGDAMTYYPPLEDDVFLNSQPLALNLSTSNKAARGTNSQFVDLGGGGGIPQSHDNEEYMREMEALLQQGGVLNQMDGCVYMPSLPIHLPKEPENCSKCKVLLQPMPKEKSDQKFDLEVELVKKYTLLENIMMRGAQGDKEDVRKKIQSLEDDYEQIINQYLIYAV